jgi:hypothetical protein
VLVIVRWAMPQVCPKRESPVPDRHWQATIPPVWRSTSPRTPQAASSGRAAAAARHPNRRQPTGVYRWLITLEGRSVCKGLAPGRAEAAAAVSHALNELPPEVVDVMLVDCELGRCRSNH